MSRRRCIQNNIIFRRQPYKVLLKCQMEHYFNKLKNLNRGFCSLDIMKKYWIE